MSGEIVLRVTGGAILPALIADAGEKAAKWGRSRESSHFRSRSVCHRQGASGLGWRYAHADAARRAVRVECTE